VVPGVTEDRKIIKELYGVMAIAIALLLHVATFLPLVLAALRPAHIPAIVGSMATAIIALIFLQSGVLQQNRLASADVSHLFTTNISSDRCAQVIDTLVEAGIAVGRPGPDGFVVNGAAWDQLPQTIQGPVLSCVQQLADPESPDGQIELIRR
jgi:hypothetical protein